MTYADQISLAHEADFHLGQLLVRPGVRQLVDRAGNEKVIEPRVMQVLVALHRADGRILTRDDLTQACWQGRVVGDDAINRVLSRLRQLASDFAQDSFRVETITRVGYRLIVSSSEAASLPGTVPPPAARQPSGWSRRKIIASGGVALAGAGLAGAGIWLSRGAGSAQMPATVSALMAQAAYGAGQASPDGAAQALGLLRQVVTIAPDYADGWGALAMAYAGAAHGRDTASRPAMAQRARSAIQRALVLDPDNGNAAAARVALLPAVGAWSEADAILRPALVQHPDNRMLLGMSAGMMAMVGRVREAVAAIEHLAAISPPSPSLLFRRTRLLWAADRLEDADNVMQHAFALYPSHFAVWFTRFYLLLYTGRPGEALAQCNDVAGRPTGIPSRNFDLVTSVARAMIDHDPTAIESALATNVAAAHQGAGFAENAIQFAAAFGRLDLAFEIANGYYLGRGFPVADQRFSAEQGSFTDLRDRRTYLLFEPPAAAIRRDPRFGALVTGLGLERYWARSGVLPDYRRR